MKTPQRVCPCLARPVLGGWVFVQPGAAPSLRVFVRQALLAIVILAASQSLAFADAVLLLGEAYGRFATHATQTLRPEDLERIAVAWSQADLETSASESVSGTPTRQESEVVAPRGSSSHAAR